MAEVEGFGTLGFALCLQKLLKFGRSFMVTGFTTTFITAQDPMEFEGFMLAYS